MVAERWGSLGELSNSLSNGTAANGARVCVCVCERVCVCVYARVRACVCAQLCADVYANACVHV